MRIDKPMNNVTFGSNINVLPYNKFMMKYFDATGIKVAESDAPPIIDKFVGTYGLSCCVGGCVNNSEKAMAFHYSSAIDGVSPYIESLGTGLRGLVTGGDDETPSIVGFFVDVFKKNNIDFSVIAEDLEVYKGDEAGAITNFVYSKIDDTYNLGIRTVETLQDLFKTMKTIHISDNDRLLFDDTEISKAELQKALEFRNKKRL